MASKSIAHLVVGVDYGTTFSGVTYVWSNATGIEDVKVLDRWGISERNDGHYSFEKQVPSRICYDNPITWGFDIEPGALTYSWTKLLLDRDAKESDFDDARLKDVYGEGLLRTPPGKTAEMVVADYLTQLYKHMMTQFEQLINADILRVTPIHFWFTMPALWSIKAQNSTRDAAIKAGFGSRPGDEIHMIREPEAAAIAGLNQLISNGPHPLVQVGHGVLVCDCGGGTVDLASYKINVAHPRLSLSQACVSEGGKCGSTTIDRALHQLMRARFGQKFEELPLSKRGANSKFMLQFESAKRDFGISKHHKKYRLHLKMNTRESNWYDSDENEVLLTSEDMKQLFDPVVDKIIGLLEQQMQATREESRLEIKCIVLVGGFGESAYLFQQLKDWCPQGVELINPPRSWEAICLGAAVRGLEGPVVVTKKHKSNLGFPIARDFREGIDSEEDSFLDFDGKKSAIGYTQWMISRGETITAETIKIVSIYRLWMEGLPKEYTLPLLESTLAVAPERRSHHSITEVGEVNVNLEEVDFSRFDSHELEGKYFWGKKKMYKVEFDVVIVFEDDLGYMHFRVIVQGKVVGQAKLNFGNDSS